MDYIYFFSGACLILLGAVCLSVLRRNKLTNILPWWWLGLYGFVQGIHDWLMMYASLGSVPIFFKVIIHLVMIASFLFLCEFARRSAAIVWGRRVGPQIYFILPSILLVWIFLGESGVLVVIRFLFGFFSAASVGFIFLSLKDQNDKNQPGVCSDRFSVLLKICGFLFFIYAFSIGLIYPSGNFFPANFLNEVNFLDLIRIPIQLLRGICVYAIVVFLLIFGIGRNACSFYLTAEKARKRFIFIIVCVCSCFFYFFYLGNQFVEKYSRRAERQESISRHLKARIFVHFIRAHIEKMQSAKYLSTSPYFQEVFKAEAIEPAALEEVNVRLDRFKRVLGVDVCYLMDKTGLTIASSNRESPVSFVGKNYSFRPYFQNAVRGRDWVYLAKGVTSQERGIYASFPVRRDDGEVLGVLVVKSSMDPLAEFFATYPSVFLVSPEGIIFVSSRPEWVFRSIFDLSHETREILRYSKQFGEGPWENIGFKDWDEARGTVIFRNELNYVAVEPIPGVEGWRICFVEDAKVLLSIRFLFILVFLSFYLLVSFFSVFSLRIFLDRLQVEASESVYEALVEGSPDGIALFTKEGICISFNRRGLEMLRLQKEEAIAKKLESFFPEKIRPLVCDALENMRVGKKAFFEADIAGKDIATLILAVHLAPIIEHEKLIRHFVVVMRDVTEERRSRERLLQTSKMSTVGALAMGVSHEFNNVLEIILGNAELALGSQDPELMKKAFKVITDASRRAAWIIKTMLDFTSKGSEKREFVDLGEVIRQNLILIQKVLDSQNIRVDLRLDQVPRFYCNPGQLSQAFVNIIVNARDAMRSVPEKVLTISLSYNLESSELILVFKDTGSGIPAEIKEKLFTPFVTTRGILGGGMDTQPGVGLGLFVAYGIVKQHGGNIAVESELGQGAKFIIALPIFAKEEEKEK